MTRNTTRLTTYFSLAEAATVIAALDTLREALWLTYGEQISAMHHEDDQERRFNTQQCALEFDDDPPF